MTKDKKKPVERKFVSANKGKAKAAAGGKSGTSKTPAAGEKTPRERATGKRILAAVFWLIAIGFEVLVILTLNGSLYIIDNLMIPLIVGIALILIFLVIGSHFWKKANRIDPPSKENKLKFYLWSQMGLIVAVIAFFPLVILLLKNKDLDQTTRKIVVAVAIVAMLIGGAASVDYTPVSSEDLAQARLESYSIGEEGATYWTRWGTRYHFDPDCRALARSEIIFEGTIEEAFEANRVTPCSFCAILEGD